MTGSSCRNCWSMPRPREMALWAFAGAALALLTISVLSLGV